jgi:hypothetical protein
MNIGCGPNVFPHPGWVNYDREDMSIYLGHMMATVSSVGMPDHQKRLVEYLQSGNQIDCRVHDLRDGFSQHENGCAESIYLGQVIEHVNNIYEAPTLIGECRRMLKPGGVLRITTPDLDLVIQAYLNGRMNDYAHEQPAFYAAASPSAQLAHIMYGAAGPKCTWNHYEGHMFLYAKESMRDLLMAAGFSQAPVFYYETGKSLDETLAREVVDAGMSHSFITEVAA